MRALAFILACLPAWAVAQVASSQPWPGLTATTSADSELKPFAALSRAQEPAARWQCVPGATLTLAPTAVKGAIGLDLSLFYTTPWPSALTLLVQDAEERTVASFTLRPTGAGWRRLAVHFRKDAEQADPKAGPPVRLVLTPTGDFKGTISVAKPVWLAQVPARRTPDPYCTTIYKGGTTGFPTALEWWQAYEAPTPAATPTTLEAGPIYQRYLRWVLGTSAPAGEFGEALARKQQGWISTAQTQLAQRWSQRVDGRLPVPDPTSPDLAACRQLLLPLAVAYRANPEPALLEQILQLYELIHLGGFSIGNPAYGADSSMFFSRLDIADYAHATGLLRDELQAAGRLPFIRQVLRWHTKVGEGELLSHPFEVNADSLRSEALPRLVYAFTAATNAERVRDLQIFRHWLQENLRPRASLFGFVKPDYTVNHHHGPYLVAYGPQGILGAAIATWILADSPLAIDGPTKEIIELTTQALVNVSTGYAVPIGTRGRFPDNERDLLASLFLLSTLSDQSVFSGRTAGLARRLIEAVGTDIAAESMAAQSVRLRLGWRGVAETAAALDRLLARTDTLPDYALNEDATAYNWGGFLSYRRPGWMANVQGTSRWHYDVETGIPPAIENDWGRFSRFGALELWTGRDLFTEGRQSSFALREGWDWARFPGTTSLALSLDEVSLPKVKRTFRHYSDRKLAAGVAARPDLALYANDLADVTTGRRLEAMKSVFFLGDLMVCLGSGIKALPGTAPVITTLAQSWLGPVTGAAVSPPRTTAPSLRGGDGTTYTVVRGGPLHTVEHDQTSVTAAGKPSQGRFAVGWLEHGTAPQGADYAYEIRPAVTARTPEHPAYTIDQLTESLHQITVPAQQATALVAFRPGTFTAAGVTSTDRPCLLWIQQEKEIKVLTLVDPDLACVGGAELGATYKYSDKPITGDETTAEAELPRHEHESLPTVITLTLDRAHQIAAKVAGVTLDATGTRLAVTCRAGLPVQVKLTPIP